MTSNRLTGAAGTGLIQVEDVTRRQFMASALGAALLLACSDEDEDGGSSAPQRSYTDALGNTVEIPTKPKRIVSLDPNYLGGPLLALGAPVVGIGNIGAEWDNALSAYFDEDLKKIRNVGYREEVDLETIIALKPDLIVHEVWVQDGVAEPSLTSEQMQRLSAIAPLVGLIAYESLEEKTARLVDLLGLDEAAIEDQKTEFEAIIAEMKSILGENRDQITAGYLWTSLDGGAWAAGRDVVALSEILTMTGVRWYALGEEAEKPENGGWLELSPERLREFECDLLIYSFDLTPAADISGQPLYQQLEVVKEGQVIKETQSFFGTHYLNYIACSRWMLEQLKAMQPIRTDIV